MQSIAIKPRFDDFKGMTLDIYTADAKTIRHTAGLCLKRVPLSQRLRLLGVRVASLVKSDSTDKFKENSPPAPVMLAQAATDLIVTTSQLF